MTRPKDLCTPARFKACRIALAFLLLPTVAVVPSVSARAQDIVIGNADAAVPKPALPISRIYTFAIPRQPLEDALNAFTATTGIQVFYSSALADGHIAQGVKGPFTADAALRQLLAGSYLAPMPTAPDAITLILEARAVPAGGAGLTAAPPTHAPLLALDPLHVEAPTVRGYVVYATSVRFAIRSALTRASAIRNKRYSAAINVWISPAGAIQHSEIHVSTGDRGLDAAISRIVLAIGSVQAPPNNLPQPLHVLISTRSPS